MSTPTQKAADTLSAIAHEGRLTLLRLLIQAGTRGLHAGELAERARVGATTASAQLLVLKTANLVQCERQGRQMVYSANYAAMSELLNFLMHDCCCGRSEICQPVAEQLL